MKHLITVATLAVASLGAHAAPIPVYVVEDPNPAPSIWPMLLNLLIQLYPPAVYLLCIGLLVGAFLWACVGLRIGVVALYRFVFERNAVPYQRKDPK